MAGITAAEEHLQYTQAVRRSFECPSFVFILRGPNVFLHARVDMLIP